MSWTLIATALAVTNATEAEPGDLPEVVMFLGGSTHTGTLIHPRWVLATASAFKNVDLTIDPTGGGPLVVPGTSFTTDTERVEVTEVPTRRPLGGRSRGRRWCGVGRSRAQRRLPP